MTWGNNGTKNQRPKRDFLASYIADHLQSWGFFYDLAYHSTLDYTARWVGWVSGLKSDCVSAYLSMRRQGRRTYTAIPYIYSQCITHFVQYLRFYRIHYTSTPNYYFTLLTYTYGIDNSTHTIIEHTSIIPY